jgi:hypothetical protein
MIATGLSWQPWMKSRFGRRKNVPEARMSHELLSIESSRNRPGPYDRSFAARNTFCQGLRR